jgi:uncharacterized SAM-binding protein YcdF (DUF218 family)
MEALILLTCIGIFWLIGSRRIRRRVVVPAAVLVILYLVFTAPFMVRLATWGLTTTLPRDTGEAVDTIVVLGRGEELRYRRVELVKQVWQTRRSPPIFISGMLDAQPMIEQLKGDGIPGKKLGGESCSRTTVENALFTEAALYPQGIRKILLVTDAPHMLRSLLTFRSLGFTVFPHFSPLPPHLNSRDQSIVVLREYLGLVSYALLGHFKPRTVQELNNPPAEILEKFSSWKCRVQGA